MVLGNWKKTYMIVFPFKKWQNNGLKFYTPTMLHNTWGWGSDSGFCLTVRYSTGKITTLPIFLFTWVFLTSRSLSLYNIKCMIDCAVRWGAIRKPVFGIEWHTELVWYLTNFSSNVHCTISYSTVGMIWDIILLYVTSSWIYPLYFLHGDRHNQVLLTTSEAYIYDLWW